MITRLSSATIRRLATEGHLQYIMERPITLTPDRIAQDDDAGWELIETPGYDGPGAYIDTQTGDMWRVCVHMGQHPRTIMEPGIVRVTITGDALLPYLPHLVMRPR